MKHLFALAVWLLPCTLCAYTFRGNVADADGSGLEFANIAVSHSEDSTFFTGSVTDSVGHFEFDLPTGSYMVKFMRLGYVAETIPINIGGDMDLGTLVLKNDAIMLDGVEVKANRPLVERNALGFAVSVDNVKSLQNKSVDRILRMSPGVFVTNDGSISINGVSGATVEVNGKTLRISGDQLMSYLQSIQGSDLKDIEVLSNPISAYEAEGAGGVIRINMKRKPMGLSGYVSGNFAYHDDPEYDGTAGLTYATGNISLYGNYSYNSNRATNMRYSLSEFADGTSNSIEQYFRNHDRKHTYRAGFDWYPSGRHYLGLEYNGQSSSTDGLGNTSTEIFSTINDLEGRIGTEQCSGSKPNNNLYNVNYIWTIDTLGQQLKVIADYSDINSSGQIKRYTNRYFDASGIEVDELGKLQVSGENIEIYSAQTDYEKPFSSVWKFSSGAKFSKVKTVYENHLTNWRGTVSEEDGRYADYFKYDESRYALYANVYFKKANFEWNAGLRGEYTRTKGVSYVKDEINKNDYFRLFPSVFAYYKLDEDNGLMAYYGKRIDRPSYQLVDPYVSYVSDVAVRMGNPGLKPQYTDAVELTYLLKNKYYFSFRAHLMKNRFTDFQTVDNGVTVTTVTNSSRRNWYHFTAYVPFDWRIWNSSVYLMSGIYDLADGNRKEKAFTFQFEWQNYLQFTDNFGMQALFLFVPKSSGSENVYLKNCRHLAQFDLSLDYTFWNGRMMLSAGLDDVFNTRGERHYVSEYDDVREDARLRSLSEGRNFWVGLKYNFSIGKKKSSVHSKEKSNSDEMRRL